MQGHALRFLTHVCASLCQAYVTHSSPGALGGERASIVSGCELLGTEPWNHLLKMVTGTSETGIPEGMEGEAETGSTFPLSHQDQSHPGMPSFSSSG